MLQARPTNSIRRVLTVSQDVCYQSAFPRDGFDHRRSTLQVQVKAQMETRRFEQAAAGWRMRYRSR